MIIEIICHGINITSGTAYVVRYIYTLPTRSFGTDSCDRPRSFSVEPTRLEGTPGHGPSLLIKQTVIIHSMHENNEKRIHQLLKTNKCTNMSCVYSKTRIKTVKKLLYVSIYRSIDHHQVAQK
jgi:hypothetical protein